MLHLVNAFFFATTGRAVFADKGFAKGTFLLQYPGQLLTAEEAEERESSDKHDSMVFRFFFNFKGQPLW